MRAPGWAFSQRRLITWVPLSVHARRSGKGFCTRAVRCSFLQTEASRGVEGAQVVCETCVWDVSMKALLRLKQALQRYPVLLSNYRVESTMDVAYVSRSDFILVYYNVQTHADVGDTNNEPTCWLDEVQP